MSSIAERVLEELKYSRIALDEALAELRETKRSIRTLRTKIDILEAVVGEDDDSIAPQVQINGHVSGASGGVLINHLSTPDAIYEILREAGGRLRITEIVHRAILKGYCGPSEADRARVFAMFSSALARDVKSDSPRFRKINRGTFDIAARFEQEASLLNDRREN